MKFIIILFCFRLTAASFEDRYDCSYCQPEQIHIAFGEKINDILMTWATFDDTGESRVQYGEFGEDDLRYESNGSSSVFKEGRGQFIHRVTLKDLKYDTKYKYHCGSKYAWSNLFEFKTPQSGDNAMVRAAIYGDMGVDNAHSLPYLQDESERNHFDFILHVGDFAYDLNENHALKGDQFMRQIEPIAAIAPYMTVPGNHEQHKNFTHYKARFSMPYYKSQESMYYSWDIGPVHFVGVNTEAWWFHNYYGMYPLTNQFAWLTKDLEEANKAENRKKHPWIILYGHRPMYCSNSDDIIDCSSEWTRIGIDGKGKYSMEPLLKKYGVDIVIWAHDHSYERLWPVYDGKVYNGSLEHPYVNPGAPVHIITGSAGCRETPDPFVKHPKAWSAFRSSDYGYTRFHAYNHTHIYFEQVSVDKKGEVIDSIWVVKEVHAPYDALQDH